MTKGMVERFRDNEVMERFMCITNPQEKCIFCHRCLLEDNNHKNAGRAIAGSREYLLPLSE